MITYKKSELFADTYQVFFALFGKPTEMGYVSKEAGRWRISGTDADGNAIPQLRLNAEGKKEKITFATRKAAADKLISYKNL